jgi:tripartite-type tricarboxylate transporter receptor subunit TctC
MRFNDLRCWTRAASRSGSIDAVQRRHLLLKAAIARGHIMQLPRRTFLKFAGAAVAAHALSRVAAAQVYPSRPITLIVPYPAGGPVDAAARVLVERMRRALGQTIIIENIGGAEGSIGTGRVARSPPDGYTIELGNLATHVLNAALYSLSYDMFNDFAPIAMLGSTPYVLFARKTMQANNLNELIAWLKANSDRASVGHPASSVVKLVEVVFQKQTGTKFTVVPYRGAAPAMQDLVAGQIDLVFSNASATTDRLGVAPMPAKRGVC